MLWMEHYWKQQEPMLSMTFLQEQHPTIIGEYFYAWYLSTIDQIGDLKNLHVGRINYAILTKCKILKENS
jgi:hypothetical protein